MDYVIAEPLNIGRVLRSVGSFLHAGRPLTLSVRKVNANTGDTFGCLEKIKCSVTRLENNKDGRMCIKIAGIVLSSDQSFKCLWRDQADEYWLNKNEVRAYGVIHLEPIDQKTSEDERKF